MAKVTVIGAGNVGATVANAVAHTGYGYDADRKALWL